MKREIDSIQYFTRTECFCDFSELKYGAIICHDVSPNPRLHSSLLLTLDEVPVLAEEASFPTMYDACLESDPHVTAPFRILVALDSMELNGNRPLEAMLLSARTANSLTHGPSRAAIVSERAMTADAQSRSHGVSSRTCGERPSSPYCTAPYPADRY